LSREAFAPSLPAWLDEQLPFDRKALLVDDRLVHLVDHGEGRPVLMVHGNPTWSYLWRKVIARLDGVRAIAPDLVGFGLSDKPSRPGYHQLDTHVQTLCAVVDALELDEITVVGQDWGGPVAAGVAARRPDRVRACVFGNTSLLRPARPFRSKPFHKFSHLPLVSEAAFYGAVFPVPILDRVQGDRGSIGRAEKRAYRYPFKRLRDRAGPLGLARMVPNREGHPSNPVLDETDAWIRAFRGPSALVWGKRDPILGRALRRHREVLPDASVVETEAGHFSQEEIPEVWAEAILEIST
jgi:haloalkane dehalogenase